MKRNHILRTIVATLLCLMMVVPSMADVLKLPSGTKEIEDYAFYGDTSLDEVVLPEGIEEIGDYAFAESGLKKINLPTTLENIADSALDKDKNIEVTAIKGTDAYDWAVKQGHIKEKTNAELFKYYSNGDGHTCTVTGYVGTPTGDLIIPSHNPNGLKVTHIRSEAFKNMTGFTGNLIIPNTVTNIEYYAFYGCSGFTGDLIIPDSVTYIGFSAFYGCSGFTGDLIIPNSVTYLGDSAFYGCSGFTGALKIPSSLEWIADRTFEGCSGLESVAIPEGITGISAYAFQNCSSLVSLSLPTSLTRIGGNAFYWDDHTLDVYLPDNFSASIDEYYSFPYSAQFYAHVNTSAARTVSSYGRTFVDSELSPQLFLRYYDDNGDEGLMVTGGTDVTVSLIIPEGVTKIADSAFCQNSSINIIIFPDTIKHIGDSAFSHCGIDYVTLPDGIESIGGYNSFPESCTIYSHIDSITARSLGKSSLAFVDPDKAPGVKMRYLFVDGNEICLCVYNADGEVISVTISEGVTEIPRYSTLFNDWDYLEEIKIKNGLTIIRQYTFDYCHNFKRIYIPESVEIIEDYAFNSCRQNLSEVYCVYPSSAWTWFMENGFGSKLIKWDDSFDKKVTVKPDGIVLPINSILNFSAEALPKTYNDSFNWSVQNISGSGVINQHGGFIAVSAGEVTIRATLKDGTGSYGEAKVYIGNFLTGSIITAGGDPVSDVRITAVNSLDNSEIYSAISKADGTWLMDVKQGETYSVSYSHTSYTISSKTEKANAGDKLKAIASTADEAAVVTNVTYASTSIEAGTELDFTVTASNAQKVQLIIDNEYYDEYWLDGNTIHQLRKINMSGDRAVSFRAYGENGWGSASEITIIHVTAQDSLSNPEAKWSQTVYVGKPQTVSWSQVNNADGYFIYLVHPTGAIERIEPQEMGNLYVKGNAETPYSYSYTFPETTFDKSGEWSIRLMAYGKGYSQSSALCKFTVSDAYEPWEGWVQSETVPAYETANATSANGHYVDYLDPVTVKGETENGRYFITMTLTAGGTADRYVDKSNIDTEPYSPNVTLSKKYWYQNNQLIISVTTNLAAKHAGINNTDGRQIANTYNPSYYPSTYRKTYNFGLPVPSEETVYQIWAANGDDKIVQNLTVVPPAQETDDPTPPPETDDPEETVTPTPTPATTDPVIPVDPESTTPPPRDGCAIVNGVHTDNVATLKDLILVADSTGIYASAGVCKTCGAPVDCKVLQQISIGFIRDSSLIYTYYHNDTTSYTLKGLSVKSLSFDAPVEISKSTDLQGADLEVSGKLTIKAPLTNVGNITCKELQVDNGGSIKSTKEDGKVSTNGGNVTINSGGSIQISGSIYAGRFREKQYDVDIYGSVTAKDITGYNVYVKEGSNIQAQRIICGNDLIVKGHNFQYEGKVSLWGYVKMDDTEKNYIKDIELLSPLIKMDKNKKAYQNYDVSKNKVKITRNVEYSKFDDTMVKYACDQIFKTIKDWLGDQFVKDNNFYQLYQDAKKVINLYTDGNGKISKETVRSLYDQSGNMTGESKESIADRWSGQLGLALTDPKSDRALFTTAVKVGLQEEMFFVDRSHTILKGNKYSINFDTIKSMGEKPFLCYGKTWYIDVTDGSFIMGATVTVDETTKNTSISWLTGTIRQGTSGKPVTWSFNPDSIYDMYHALMVSGLLEVQSQLESAISDAIDSLEICLDDIEQIDDLKEHFWNKVDSNADCFFSKHTLDRDYSKLVEVQHSGATAYEVIGDIQDEIKAFNVFNDLYKQAKNLKTNTIQTN